MTEITPTSAVGAELRIITAGRTGFENDLRRDESIELIRARTSLDAIGELANPIDELSPSGTVLLVGPDALTPEEAGEFIAAVRQIKPDARIILISDSTAGADRFDAVLPIGSAADRLWKALGVPGRSAPTPPAPPRVERHPKPTTERTTAHTPAPDPTEPDGPIGLAGDTPAGPGPAPASSPRSNPVEIHTRPIRPAKIERDGGIARPVFRFEPVDVLDEAMLTILNEPGEQQDIAPDDAAMEAALSGGDTLRAGLAELRAELGTETVRFTPGDSAGEGEPVRRGGRVFGALRADGVDRKNLERSALWLASRLALGEQLIALREAAFTDELTGAWNRRFFCRFLDRSIDRARANRQDLSLMLFDIDDFKAYNDRYGHAAGDEILVEAIRLLIAVVRPHDRVCRIGGDEFAVVFADGPREASSRHPASIEAIARRFQRQICEHRFPKLGSNAMGTLTVSGGLATFPWEAHNSASLIELADQLAMQSKRAGKNVITMGPGADRVCDAMGPDEEPGL
jgi:diguanylate cyclase (GGDEF)-like protein